MKIYSFLLFLFFSSSLCSQTFIGNQKDIDKILSNIKSFSVSVMNSDYKSIGLAYTEDAKIFPNNKEILKGKEAIINYWVLPKGFKTKYHKIKPEEIKIIGDEAYDYGYYEGITLRPDGSESNWKGKYVIVWKKINGDWKMYLDIWNSIKQ
ncbi:YybH family protein [Polaribacter marinivivus]|uniref:YybH family protein n=1 Tax=Polaribacter marinivivus TaxID=1524260 RepID=A0ABV8RCN7_9FLAO